MAHLFGCLVMAFLHDPNLVLGILYSILGTFRANILSEQAFQLLFRLVPLAFVFGHLSLKQVCLGVHGLMTLLRLASAPFTKG